MPLSELVDSNRMSQKPASVQLAQIALSTAKLEAELFSQPVGIQ